MRIGISGASGFIGTFLTEWFMKRGVLVIPFHRELFHPENESELIKEVELCDVIINLAGATIQHRWTKKYKTILYESRINTTRSIVNAINKAGHKPQVFISASAVGSYPAEGVFDDYSMDKGKGFLSELCGQWEYEAKKVSPEVRLVITRFGVVLSKKGGAFPKMVKTAPYGVSVFLGTGKQFFPWIDIQDLAKIMAFIIQNTSLQNVVNVVAPDTITQKEFAHITASYYHSFAMVRIPSFLLQFFLGEFSGFLSEGGAVLPKKLQEAGYKYKSSILNDFLFDS